MKVKMKYNLMNTKEDIKKINLELDNVQQLSQDEYSTVLSAYELATLYEEDKIGYYSPIQRGVKQKRLTGGKTIDIPVSSDKNIKEMTNLIINGGFYTSQITLCILKDETNNIEYKDGKLITSDTLLVLDGFHRISSVYRAYQYSKVIGGENEIYEKLNKLMFPVKIVHYDEDTAKTCFSQLSLGLKLNTSRVQSFDMSKASNRIVDKLNKYSVLKGKINTNRTSILKTDTEHIYTFSTLNEAIKNSFGTISNEKEENEIYEFLATFFKELFTIFPEITDEETRQVSKEYSLISENIMAYGFISIAEMLFLKRYKDWKTELNNISKINFDKDANIWQSIVRVHEDRINIINNKNTRSILCRILRQEFVNAQEVD